MSSLAYSDFNQNNENNNNTSNIIQKKREVIRHNKTIKRKENNEVKSNPKLMAMMKRIHENEEDDDEGDYENDSLPLPPPQSASMERMDNLSDGTVDDDHLSHDQQHQQKQHEAFTQLPSEYAKNYYQQYVPYYNQSSDDNTPSGANKDELLSKLNQIIYLLEEQQEEKTDNVMEELILYSFLGIFIIFIVDSFARAGKYVR
jgi:hypothetical protein